MKAVLFPLQVSITDFALTPTISATDFIIFFSAVAVVILISVVVRSYQKKSHASGEAKNADSGSGSVSGFSPGIFSGFKVHRIARSMGLNREQRKMLDFALKIDGSTDPEKSIITPALLDRHFKRAYRVILQSEKTEEETQNRLSVLFSARNMLENNAGMDITSTRQLRDDSNFIVSNGKEKYNVAVYSTRGDQLAVECPKTPTGTQIKLDKGTKLNVILYMKNNRVISFDTRVLGYSTAKEHTSLLLAHTNQLKSVSQRRFRRRQTDIDCNLNLVYVEGEGRKQRLIVDKRKFAGEIADISVGGCSLKTKAQVQVGAKLKMEFVQGGNVATLGQVLRSNRTGVNTILHIKFLRVSRKSMNLINAYVYECLND